MSTLIEANGQTLIFDVGRGALQNIYLSRIDPRSVTKVFLTHLHSDHIEGLPSIWMGPWFMFAQEARASKSGGLPARSRWSTACA